MSAYRLRYCRHAMSETQLLSYLNDAKRDPLSAECPTDMRVLMLPHIDYERGWGNYRAAFRALSAMERPDLIVMVGTSHAFGRTLFHLTPYTYRLPEADVEVEHGIVERLSQRLGGAPLAFESFYDTEWSIELPLTFIFHAFRAEMPPIVPLIVSSFDQFASVGMSPLEDSRVAGFIDVFADEITRERQAGRRILFVAPVDLSHRGAEFEEDERAVPDLQDETRAHDLRYLELNTRPDHVAAFQMIGQNPTRIDAVAPVYTLFETLKRCYPPTKGRVLRYEQSTRTRPCDCLVSHAVAAWGS